MKRIALLLLALALAGCEERVITHSARVPMEVVKIKFEYKSNSKVDLRVIGTGMVYRNQRLNCSKTAAERVRMGSRWDVVVEDWKQGDRYGTTLQGVGAICRLSKR